MSVHLRSGGPLGAPDLALAAVMSCVAVALAVIGGVLPHAGALQVLGAVPMGVVAYRTRLRALSAAAAAGVSVAFLVGGSGPAWGVLGSAVVGGVVGEVKRRNGSWRMVLVVSLVAGALAAVGADLVLLVFGQFRMLTLASVRSLVFGMTGLARNLSPLRSAAVGVERWTDAAIRSWWITVGIALFVGSVVGVLLVWKLLGAVLVRLAWLPLEDPLPPGSVSFGGVGPLPVRLSGVGFYYPGAPSAALSDIDLRIGPGDFVVLTGPNGSGKSTLARLLAGHAVTSGVIERSGDVGLGLVGGTVWIGQRPESQILGATVADDVVWGLPPTAQVDVAALLRAVGLDGSADRNTSTLSGGELQRLAVAAALARRPALLISDESTAMVDSQGRRALMDLLHELPGRGTAVVHVTHDVSEIAPSDRVVRLDSGRQMPPSIGLEVVAGSGPQTVPVAIASVAAEPMVRLRGVTHTYAGRTPWEHTVLTAVNLDLQAGDGLLVVGANGSGKSTLAWILAGLTRPTGGSVTVDGHPAGQGRGSALLAFQHARLQVQARDVRSELGPAAGADEVARILSTVGLDPDLADRPVDRLSGGQLRRVALAGLIARRPRLLILDEPLAGLDAPGRMNLLDLLARARFEFGLTLIVISHDNVDMHRACSHAMELTDGRLGPMHEMADA